MRDMASCSWITCSRLASTCTPRSALDYPTHLGFCCLHISSLLLHTAHGWSWQLLTSALQVTCSLRMALSEASKASIEPYALGRLPPPAERIDLESWTQTRQMLEAGLPGGVCVRFDARPELYHVLDGDMFRDKFVEMRLRKDASEEEKKRLHPFANMHRYFDLVQVHCLPCSLLL
jgi:hypothetical protein